MNREQLALFEKAELEACDALDGLKDGILGNTNACRYDGSPLLCREGQTGSDACLTSGQVESIRRILADKDVPVPLADGVVGYPGYGRGAPTEDWVTYIFGTSFAARDGADFVLAENIVKHGIPNDPNASLMTHDPTQWKAQYLALSNEIDATNPDLSAFYEHGGKLIVWFGIADGCVTYKRTRDYLNAVDEKLGREVTRKFVRFFTSPGSGHDNTGPGANQIAFMTALENWVENAQPPDGLVASKLGIDGTAHETVVPVPAVPEIQGQWRPERGAELRVLDGLTRSLRLRVAGTEVSAIGAAEPSCWGVR